MNTDALIATLPLGLAVFVFLPVTWIIYRLTNNKYGKMPSIEDAQETGQEIAKAPGVLRATWSGGKPSKLAIFTVEVAHDDKDWRGAAERFAKMLDPTGLLRLTVEVIRDFRPSGGIDFLDKHYSYPPYKLFVLSASVVLTVSASWVLWLPSLNTSGIAINALGALLLVLNEGVFRFGPDAEPSISGKSIVVEVRLMIGRVTGFFFLMLGSLVQLISVFPAPQSSGIKPTTGGHGAMEWTTVLVAFVGMAATIVGSVIGARVGGKAVKESVLIAAEKAREAEQERERNEIANVRKALLAEIITTKDRYMEGIGQGLEAHPNNQPFNYIYPAYQRYFVIFEESARFIGKIPDDRERGLIVQCYTLAKGLLDSYKLNNSMVEKRDYAVGLGPVVLGGVNSRVVQADIEATMIAYVPVLKQMHDDALTLFAELRASLEKPLV